jgi:uncharacterized membrane protein
MNSLPTLGRLFFAVSLAAFGIQYLNYGHYLGGLPPVPPWAPGGSMGAYSMGAILLATSISIALNWHARASSFFIGILFLLCALFLHTQKLHELIFDGNSRTRVLDVFAIGAAAFVLAAALPAAPFLSRGTNTAIEKLSKFGVLLFAFTLIIFGGQHFQFAKFIAFLIPAWMPVHLFLAYFTGVAMIATGLSIAFNVLAKLSSLLLAAMFFLWVVLLHAPRVAAKLHNGDEWSSLFVALAMSGASLIIAGSFSKGWFKVPSLG